jgi:hypothetical protein
MKKLRFKLSRAALLASMACALAVPAAASADEPVGTPTEGEVTYDARARDLLIPAPSFSYLCKKGSPFALYPGTGFRPNEGQPLIYSCALKGFVIQV